jgi:hypothetical protein
MPRSGKVLIAPSPIAIMPLIMTGLKNRSALRLCIKLSVEEAVVVVGRDELALQGKTIPPSG